MKHLLYSSNEMFSSTQLVRKSKSIFDKLCNNEISKAIILRDGKPNFMLLDFNKYESIMKEFEEYKTYYDNNKNIKVSIVNKTNDVVTHKEKENVDTIKEINPNEDINFKEQEELELKQTLKDLETMEFGNDTTSNNSDDKASGEIKEFWN